MDIFTIVGQLTTWITILLVYFTLREMRNQRKASQKPDLIIPQFTIYGYADRESSDSSLMITNWSDRDEEESLNHVWSESTRIKLYNVGFGVAKNIELKWTFNCDKTIQQIKDYCYKYSVPIILERKDDRLYISGEDFRVNQSSSDFWHPISLSTWHSEHGFLMPASITSEGLRSGTPRGIIVLLAISAYLKTHFSEKDSPSGEAGIEQLLHFMDKEELKIDLPSMELELCYDDLENSHYTKKFEVLFKELSRVNYTSQSGLIKVFSGSFEFENLKQ